MNNREREQKRIHEEADKLLAAALATKGEWGKKMMTGLPKWAQVPVKNTMTGLPKTAQVPVKKTRKARRSRRKTRRFPPYGPRR